jgi:hypothetical protein
MAFWLEVVLVTAVKVEEVFLELLLREVPMILVVIQFLLVVVVVRAMGHALLDHPAEGSFT